MTAPPLRGYSSRDDQTTGCRPSLHSLAASRPDRGSADSFFKGFKYRSIASVALAHFFTRWSERSRLRVAFPILDSGIVAVEWIGARSRDEATATGRFLQRVRWRTVDHGSRTTAKDSQRRYAELAARPVLARLPDVSAEVELLRTEQKAAQGVGYRFDPPQGAERGSGAVHAERTARFPTLKSELIYAPRTSRTHQPHVFDRSRRDLRQGRGARRESPVLPRTNPFAIPQRGILDSLAPFLRFATLVALFAAAGTWLQAVAFRSAPPVKPADTPNTTAQEPINPNTKTAERPAGSTSAGPVRSTPEPNKHVGRARENDFAKLRGDILPVTSAADTVEPAMPGLASASGELPRVQTTELPAESTDGAAARPGEAAQVPEVARATRGFRVIPPLPR